MYHIIGFTFTASRLDLHFYIFVIKINMFIIYFTWCILQTLIGLFLYLIYKLRNKIVAVKKIKTARLIFVKTKLFTGVSLGRYIFISDSEIKNENTIKHEYGHTVQSFIFGPLYLLAVGLPSVLRNIIWRINKFRHEDYFKGYPENWADKLGGVKR